MSFNNKSIYLTEITVPDLEALIANVIKKELEPILQNALLQKPKADDSYVSRKEAAAILKISIPTLTKLVSDGLLPGYKLGNSIRFKKSSLEKGLVEIRSKKYRLGMALAN